MNPRLRQLLGWAASAVGLACLASAFWLGWTGWQRWQGAVQLRQASVQALLGRREEAQRTACRAGLDGDPAAELLAADLARPEDRSRLLAVHARTAPGRDREALAAAIGLGRVLAGEKPDIDMPASDARLCLAIAAWQAGQDAPWPQADREHPPHRAVQLAAHAACLRRAVAAGDAELARSQAGCLLLLHPRHPWRDELLRLSRPAGEAKP